MGMWVAHVPLGLVRNKQSLFPISPAPTTTSLGGGLSPDKDKTAFALPRFKQQLNFFSSSLFFWVVGKLLMQKWC